MTATTSDNVSHPRDGRGSLHAACALATMLCIGGCTIQPPYSRPQLDMPNAWANARASTPVDGAESVRDDWWTQLGDPAIDVLVASALADNPTLAQAAARVDEARAGLGASRARRAPQLDGNGALSRGKSQSQAGGTDTINATSGSLGTSLSWELDLWGRARATEEAARSRLDARNADAEEARLSLVARIADGVVALRACNYSLAIRDQDIGSRETELSLIRQRLAVGNVARVEEASALSALASARTNRLSQEETCMTLVDALVALSGREATTIRRLMSRPPLPFGGASTASAIGQQHEAAGIVPTAPPARPDLPATVLLQHPAVRSAERELAASYAEIGVARAERLPRVDLSALLTGQWIRTLGSTIHFDTWSAGAAASVPIFDAGLGAANVDGAEARYRVALAGLASTLRTAMRDVEDSLAALSSAEQRADTSRQAADAAAVALRANEARYRAGAISLFELEGSRRQFNGAQESAIAAASDRARSWVSLMRATGNPPLSAAALEQPVAVESADTPTETPVAGNESHR
ncbi:efflux transporter outer membrane subunit [Pseudomonas indica]|uniref:efflux transporter outer membrane subunit n=1 Tax=Pseudomonas indica TaxID=137658 RepID=UPI001C3EC6CE|nr:efflux transporter outer membrane subunit [Pseudomonas indica]